MPESSPSSDDLIFVIQMVQPRMIAWCYPPDRPRSNCCARTACSSFPGAGCLSSLQACLGTYHEAWVEAPAQTVRVSDFHFKDRATALLTLDDGREIRVILDGSVVVTRGDGEGIALTPTITLSITDPGIAALPPEELRRRLVILVEGAVWCSHWDDAALQQSALDLATAQAIDAMDWLSEGDLLEGISNELRRETLLHLKAKEILERERKINLPTLSLIVEENGPLGRRSRPPGICSAKSWNWIR